MLRFRCLSVAAILIAVSLTSPASANWLTHILKEAGEAGGKAGRHAHPELGAAGKAAKHLGDLADAPKGALAAHATPEGHWTFVNREGQTFTAGTADELKRVGSALTPEAGEGKLTLYLSEDSVFTNKQHLDKLPKDADLYVVTDHGAYPVTRAGNAGKSLSLKLKPNLSIDLADKDLFQETISYLSRPLNKSGIRAIALEPGSSNLLSAAPRFDAATKAALVDKLDPVHLNRAFSGIRGQTAVVVGRVDNGKLFFKPQSGPEMSRDVEELLSAARQNDVNLVLLHADTPLQPGGQNWLWQKIEVGGFDDAIGKQTFGDFLDALAARRAPMSIDATREGLGRVRISAVADEAGGVVSSIKPTLGEVIEHITGEVITKAAEIHVRDDSSQKEIDGQLIPGIPTYIQIPYLMGIVLGILGWATSRSWWGRIWAPPARAEGEGRLAQWLRGAPNFLAYLLLFLPVAGMPAFAWYAMKQFWASVTAPFRWIWSKLRRRVEV
jgi:hypothetical protein